MSNAQKNLNKLAGVNLLTGSKPIHQTVYRYRVIPLTSRVSSDDCNDSRYTINPDNILGHILLKTGVPYSSISDIGLEKQSETYYTFRNDVMILTIEEIEVEL